MAVHFNGRESLVPSQLLTDDDTLLWKDHKFNNSGSTSSESVLNGFGSSGSCSSGFSTPIESELLCSTETQREDDDFIAELTRQMADFMLQDDDEHQAPNCGPENFKSPPTSVLANVKSRGTGFFCNPALTDDQKRPIQFVKQRGSKTERRAKTSESTQQLEAEPGKQHQDRKQQHSVQNKRRERRICIPGSSTPSSSSPGQRGGPGMSTVFVGESESTRRSSGTGVFLPRATNNATEPRKKSGCSTVLVPARVLQALQQHFSNMDSNKSKSDDHGGTNGYPYQSDAIMGRRNGLHSQQKRHLKSQTRRAMKHQEMDLPPEWTY